MDALVLTLIVTLAVIAGCGIGHAIYKAACIIEDLVYQARLYNRKENRYVTRTR
jgi:hypothetical protein